MPDADDAKQETPNLCFLFSEKSAWYCFMVFLHLIYVRLSPVHEVNALKFACGSLSQSLSKLKQSSIRLACLHSMLVQKAIADLPLVSFLQVTYYDNRYHGDRNKCRENRNDNDNCSSTAIVT